MNTSFYQDVISTLSKNVIPIIAIYDKPLDFPDKMIARMWLIKEGFYGPTNYVVLTDTLEELRKYKPIHMSILDRMEDDEPHLVENWV